MDTLPDEVVGCQKCTWLLAEALAAPLAAGAYLARHWREDHDMNPVDVAAALQLVRFFNDTVMPRVRVSSTIVAVEFTVDDRNPQRAQVTLERHLRPVIEDVLQGVLGRYVIGTPVIRARGKEEG